MNGAEDEVAKDEVANHQAICRRQWSQDQYQSGRRVLD